MNRNRHLKRRGKKEKIFEKDKRKESEFEFEMEKQKMEMIKLDSQRN